MSLQESRTDELPDEKSVGWQSLAHLKERN